MTLAAAWNADTQLDAREPGRAHLERGHAQSGHPTAATMTSRCVGSEHGQPEWRPAREISFRPANALPCEKRAELWREGGVPLVN
jgi:hypothetical protein